MVRMKKDLKKTRAETTSGKLSRKIDKLTEIVQEEFNSASERATSIERRLTLTEGRLTDVEERLGKKIEALESKMEKEFAGLHRRLDSAIQLQLDEHAHRIKKLEQKVTS